MKYVLLTAPFFLLASGVFAQSQVETVVIPPAYGDEDFVLVESGQHTQLDGITVTDESTSTELTVTTEIGTTTITQETGEVVEEEPIESLSDVVSRINQQYEEDVAQCETGSWLSRMWCKMMSWFG